MYAQREGGERGIRGEGEREREESLPRSGLALPADLPEVLVPGAAEVPRLQGLTEARTSAAPDISEGAGRGPSSKRRKHDVG